MPDEASLDISVVIPLYNERENLVELEELLEKHLQPIHLDYEVIMVDDGSLDGGSGLIRSIQKYNPRIRLVRFRKNEGQTAAFAAGFKAARGKVNQP